MMRVNQASRRSIVIVMAAVLLAFVATGMTVFFDKTENHTRQMTSLGHSIAQVLSRLPAATLLESRNNQNVLSSIWQSASASGIAYLMLTDEKGAPLAKEASQDILVPLVVLNGNAVSGVTERTINTDGQPGIHETRVPFFSGTDLVGYVIVGTTQFEFSAYLSSTNFLMMLAAPLFLLLPLVHYLLWRESEPLAIASEKLDEFITAETEAPSVDDERGEEKTFLQRFNRVLGASRDRMVELENEQVTMLSSTKLLSYQRARMLAVIESLPDAVLILDEFGTATIANGKLTDLLGMQLDQVLDKKPAEWCEFPEVVKLLSRVNGGYSPRDHEPVEFSPSPDAGQTIGVSVSPLCHSSDEGRAAGSVVLFRDVTANVMARQSRAEFVAKLGHELKSPLTVIAMYSETLIDEESPDIRIEGLNVIRDETERATGLISNMLSITKMETGNLSLERTRVRVRDLLEDAVASISRLGLQDDITVDIDCPQEIGVLALDKDLMRVAVHNLLTNAVKYNRPGGTVTLTADESDSVLRISVKDTGIGISKEDQKNVFEKFFRSDSDEACLRPGHGLGLALAHEIIGLHHGTLTVNSVVGEGTEFTIELRKQANKLRKTG